MIIQYFLNSNEAEREQVRQKVRSWGFRLQESTGDTQVHVDNVFGAVSDSHRQEVATFDCVKHVLSVEGVPLNLSLMRTGKRSEVVIANKWGGADVVIGGQAPMVVLGGVCAVDDKHTQASHEMAKAAGVQINRGGAFKPRTSPYDFQGLKEDGLKILTEVREAVGLPVVSEILDVRDIDLFMKYDIDILQTGTRNAQNFELLIEVGRTKKPVLYKRGFSNSVDEMLKAANYVMEQGNDNLMLCLRGVKGIGHSYRNQGDLDEIVALQHLSDRPIVYDVSHSSGKKAAVGPIGNMAAAGGVDGLLLDIHVSPQEALVDGFQAVSEQRELERMMATWNALHGIARSDAS